jgi:3-oxoacyl-[acyl-carrier protein] reductase
MPKILIIGASKGIGAAIALLAQANFEVLSISRSQPSIGTTVHYPCDILKDPLPAIEDPLAGLAYCPGSINLRPFPNLKIEDFRNEMELNLIGAVRCLQQYLPNLRASASASVVLFSSVAVQTGLPYHAAVSASKGAVEGLMRALAAELAPKIRVNAIAPSIIDTDLAARLLRDEDKRKAAADRHAMKRIGTVDDIAAMAVFLLSSKATWITGQVHHVDGGMAAIR